MIVGAVLNEPGEAVALEELELDEPGPGEVEVRIEASGVCHSDLHIKRTDGWGMRFPILLGHEGVGRVERVGEGVESPRRGRLRRAGLARAVRRLRAVPARGPAPLPQAAAREAAAAPRRGTARR